MTSTDTTDKPFMIDKGRVYEAYKAVKSSKGGAGVDGQLMNPLILSATQFCRAALAKEFVNESILGIVGQCGRRLSGLNSSRTISIPCSDRTCTPSASVLWPAGCSA